MAILRRHLVDKAPVSDVRDQIGIHPTLFCRWQKELFEHGAAACRAIIGSKTGRSGPSSPTPASIPAKAIGV